MKRKCSLRDSYLKKLRKSGERITWNRNGTLSRKKPLKKLSRSRRRRLQQYYPIQQSFLSKPENKLCAICIARRAHGERIKIKPATEVHHAATRAGELLFDEQHFRPSCYWCRTWPHDNPRKAQEWGLVVRLPNKLEPDCNIG